MISISIDVTLLDKSKFKRITRKNGKEAVFCDIVLLESPDNQYGHDYMVKQSITKEEKADGVQMPILGNGKYFGSNSAKPGAQPKQSAEPNPEVPEDSEIPF